MYLLPKSPLSARSRAPIDEIGILWWNEYGNQLQSIHFNNHSTETNTNMNRNDKVIEESTKKTDKATNTNVFITKYTPKDNHAKGDIEYSVPKFEEARKVLNNFMKLRFKTETELLNRKPLKSNVSTIKAHKNSSINNKITKGISRYERVTRNIDSKEVSEVKRGGWLSVRQPQISGVRLLSTSSEVAEADSRAAGAVGGPRGTRAGREPIRMPVS